MTRTLTLEEARRFYDRVGTKQDSQAFYEDVAIDELIRHSAFQEANRVFEFGCGTGRLASRLLRDHLPQQATYDAVDISPRMREIAKVRLASFGPRVTVREQHEPSQKFDRVIATYVLDLLSDDDISAFLARSKASLLAGGRLCVVNLTYGNTARSRLVTGVWRAAYRLSPRIVGGCRPLRLVEYLNSDLWRVEHHAVVCAWGIASEVVIAR